MVLVSVWLYISSTISLRETPNTQYSYENYLTEMRRRLQSVHEVARRKLVSSKEKSKEYYDKDSEIFEVKTWQNVLLFDETVHRENLRN
jgi:hypothetical protein